MTKNIPFVGTMWGKEQRKQDHWQSTDYFKMAKNEAKIITKHIKNQHIKYNKLVIQMYAWFCMMLCLEKRKVSLLLAKIVCRKPASPQLTSGKGFVYSSFYPGHFKAKFIELRCAKALETCGSLYQLVNCICFSRLCQPLTHAHAEYVSFRHFIKHHMMYLI